MMTQKVSISSVKASLSWLRHLAAVLILFFAAQGVWGQTTYIWTGADVNDNNWSTAGNWRTVNIDGNGNITNVANPATTVPGLDANDVVYIIDNSTITLTGNVTINRLRIANYANPAAAATLNLGTNTLSIGTLNLGNGNNATTNNILQMRGDLSLSNGTVTIGVFDECDNGQNTLELNTVALSITGTVYGNGGGLTTVSGSNSTFDLRNLTGNYNEGEVFSFGSGITVLADKTFWTGRTDSDWTKAENWSTGVPIADSEVVIPANPVNPPVLNTATPALKSLTIQSAIINDVLKTGTLTLNGSGILNTGTIVNGGEIILSGGTITATTSFRNNKTVTITSGTITNNNVSNGDDSTVIYNGTGTQNPIWGNLYQNLEIAAGTSISLGAATIAGTATNNGTLTITSDSFTAGTKSNGSGSKIIYSGNGVTSARWGTSYQDLEITAGTGISMGAASIAGDATNNGTLTITDNNFSVTGTKTNGGSSTIIYSGVTSTPWGLSYQNLEIASGTSISLGAATIAGTATNNGTLTITSNSFSAGTKSNGSVSTIIYSGVTSAPWGLLYQNLEIANGTSITLGAVTIAGTATNNGTLTITSDSFSAGTTSNGTQNSTIVYNGVSNPVWGYGYKNLTVSSGTITFANPVSVSGTAANNGTIIINDSISAGTFSGAGTITLAGSGGATSLTATIASTQGSIVLNNTAATITGNFTLTSFTATNATNMAGKSITLNNSTITAGSISLSGASGSLLLLNGAGTTHEFNTNSLTAAYLSIDSNIVLTNYTTAISNSVPQADNSLPASWLTVMHHGWNIKELSYFTYTWVGTTSSDWNTASNWDTGYVPPTDSRIIIPAVTTPNVYPVLPDTADFPGGTLSIAANASIQLGSKNLVLSGTDGTGAMPANPILTNSGTIIYTNAGRITNGTNVINDADTTRAGKVQYAAGGTGTITDATNGLEYYDLEVLGSGWSFSGNYKIKNKLTTGTGATGVTENCSVTNESTIQAATFDFKGPVNFTADLTLAPYDATAVFNIPANLHQKVNTTNKKWLHLGTGATPGNIVFSNDADFSYKLNLHSTATVNAQIQLRNSITATQNINGTGTIEFTGTGDQIFETNGKQFVNIHETKASGKLTINGNPTITNFTTASNAKGNIIFSNGAAITNGFTQYDGTTTVQGTISTTNAAFSVKDLILSDNTQITTGTGAQTYTTINGTAGTEVLTLSGSSITLNGNVGGTKKLAKLIFDGTLLIGADCSIKADEIDYSGNIYGDGRTVTIDTPVFKSTAASPTPGAAAITLKEINFAQANTSIQTQNSTTINLAVQTLNGSEKTITLAATATLLFASDFSAAPVIQNNGTITCQGSAEFTGNYSGSGALNLSTATTTFKGTVDLSGTNFDASTGTVVIDPTGASTTVTGPANFHNFELKKSAVINGNNSYNDFTASGLGNGQITFAAGTTQTVGGKLTLTGTKPGDTINYLTLTGTGTGTWNIYCSNATYNHTIQYVKVYNADNHASSYYLTALDSQDLGGNVKWNFPDQQYEWKGSTADHEKDWNTAANWTPASIPGKGAQVLIPAGKADYPVLEAALDLIYNDKGIITVNGTFDLADQDLSVISITNNGLIRAKGVTSQSITGTMENGNNSTVEYYGIGNNNLFWDGNDSGNQYVNLILDQTITYGNAISASGSITIKQTATLTGNITAANDITVNNTATSVTLGGTVTITGNTGVLTVNAPLIYNGSAVTTKASQSYNSTVTISQDAEFKANAGSGILFGNTVSGNSGTEKLTVSTASVQFNGAVSNLATLTTAAATINCASIGTTGAQTYGGAVTIKAGTSALTSTGGNISFANTVSGDAGTEVLTLGGSSVSFAASVTSLAGLTVNADITIGASGIQLAANQITFKGDISAADKTLVINTPALSSTKTSEAEITASQITLSQNTTVTSSNGIKLYVPVVSGNVILTNSNALTFASDFSAAPVIQNNGTITCQSSAEFTGNYSGSGTLNLSTATTTFKGTVDLSGTNFDASTGTVVIDPTGASTTVTGPADFYDFELKNSATINGSNSYHDFTASGLGNGQIIFAAGTTQTVDGKLTLTGTKPGDTINYLTLKGSGNGDGGVWNIYCTNATNNHEVQYVKVYNSNNNASSYYLTALSSQDWGGNVKWNFPNQSYTWLGSTTDHKNDWNTAANWEPSSVPGKGSIVTIPNGKTDYPILTQELNLYEAAHPGSITVDTAASINLAGQNLIVGTITNNGTVQLLGTGTQTINAHMINGSGSTVQYTGTGDGSATSRLPWDGDNNAGTAGKQYEILVLDRAANVGDDITAATITTSAAFTYNGASIVTTGAQTYSQPVTVSATPTFKSTGGLIKFESTLAGTNSATSSLTINTANSQFDGAVSNLAELNTAAATINCATIATSGNQTYGGAVSITHDTELSSAAGKQIDFTSTVTGNNSSSLTITTADVIFEGNVSQLVSLTTAAARIQCSSITTSDNQNYNGAVSVERTTELSSAAGKKIDFKSTVTGSNSSSLTIKTADVIFEGNVSQLVSLTTDAAKIQCSSITTSDNQTYNGPVSVEHDAELSSAAGKTIDFENTVTGNNAAYLSVKTANSVFKNAVSHLTSFTTEATATFETAADITDTGTLETNIAVIKCTTISTSGTQTYGGTVSLGNNCSLTSSGDDITFISTINGNQTLTLSVPAAKDIKVNGIVGGTTPPSIILTQSGSTNFKNTVTIQTFKDFTDSGNIFFKNGRIIAFDGAQSNTSGTLSFGNAAGDVMNIGTATTDASLTHTAGNTAIFGKLKAANITLGDTTGGPMTITNSGLFKTVDGKTLTYTGTFTQDGTGKNMIGGNFGGTGNASFATDTYIYGSSAAGLGTSTSTVTFTTNLSVNRTAALTFNAVEIQSDNILLYKGAVTTNSNLTAIKDIIILGADYSTTDTTTGIANEYAYKSARPDGWSNVNTGYSTSTGFETSMPDTTALPDGTTGKEFGAALSVQGKTVKAGKNFYANGTTLNGTSAWTLKVPDLTRPNLGFAEAYFSSINNCNVVCDDGSSDGSKSRLVTLECTDSGSNAHVDFDEFKIEEAYTVRDNAIYVRFNRPIRYHASMINSLKFDDGADPHKFTAFYKDADCTEQLQSDIMTKEFYIKALAQEGAKTGAWNTDANSGITEITSGTLYSTDRNGNHHYTVPCLDFPRALSGLPFIITDIWGKRLNNYSQRVTLGAAADPAYGRNRDSGKETYVLDRTGPVLYSVRTGQELHEEDPADEHSYDSHNFIEFLYSEKVDFAGSADDASLNNVDASSDTFVENIQVTDTLGAITGNITTEGSLSFAGLGTIQNGLIYTGSSGSADKYVNALYRTGRNADYSVRLSVAGYTDPVNSVTDPSSTSYKKWIGYIEHAVPPTGTVTHLVNASRENVCVLDKEGNVQIEYAHAGSNMIPSVNDNEQTSPIFASCYGDWDISEPIFAIIRQNNRTAWAAQTFEPNYQAEAIGNNSGVGSTLDRIEFHLYDNTPVFEANSPEWFTEVGWSRAGSSGSKSELYVSDSYAADIFGGARPFDSTVANRTTGGIRYSTIVNSAVAFKYGVGSSLPASQITSAFDTTKPVYPGATSLIFTGASNPRRGANNLEGLYFAVPLPDGVEFDVKTSFTVSFDQTKAYVTDLAGNRLRSKTISTIDRTPPSIDMTISPVGADEIEIVFVKEIVTDSSQIHYITDPVSLQDVAITEQFEYLIGKCFDIITIDSTGAPAVVAASDLKFDTSVPAKVWVTTNSINSAFTHIKLKLSRAITLKDIQEKYIRVTFASNYSEESVDLFTQKPGSRVTFIQDENGNTIQMYTAHALSDFAVGEVTPLYAYDSSMVEEDGTIISGGIWHTDTSDDVDTQSWAVHDWNRDQQNYGTLPADHTVAIVADTASASNVNVYLANSPDEKSVSTQANKDFEFTTPWRIWLPDIMTPVFTPLSEKNNTNFAQASGTTLDGKTNRFIFDLDSSITDLWSAGDQVSFVFGITNSDGSPVTIMHSPELDINQDKHYLTTSVKSPLFALRQTDPDDFLSLDLWSFRLKSLIGQRGGVTVLNNVIDSNEGEKVVVRVDLPKETNLTVLVMTLDGNIVDYLQRGTASKGEHYYSWDGRNRNGKPVARGMYFIRVMADGIDETRKVLVVKE